MSVSKNSSPKKNETLLTKRVNNPLLFTNTGNRIYQLVLNSVQEGGSSLMAKNQIQKTNTLEAKVYFEYLHRKFECAIVLNKDTIELTALSPSLLTPAGLFAVTAHAKEKGVFINELGIITQQGDEAIGWLIIDIINHFNACRLKPRNNKQFRPQLN